LTRILIAGGPRVGKTYRAQQLAAELGIPARSTDDLIGRLDWSAASLEVSTWMEEAGPLLIEGVAVGRAIRKFMARNEGAPADVVYLGTTPREPLTSRQVGMAKGCETVWNEIAGELVRRGVRIEEF